MSVTVTSENRHAYTAPEIELSPLCGSDVITASGPDDGFWGEEHDFGSMYNECEW